MFPALLVLLVWKYLDGTLTGEDFIAVAIVLVVFSIPIILDMAFGGGDLRFGAFCALFLGITKLGFFVLFAGILHLVILGLLQKKSFAFAPAMSLAALGAYVMGV